MELPESQSEKPHKPLVKEQLLQAGYQPQHIIELPDGRIELDLERIKTDILAKALMERMILPHPRKPGLP